MSGESDRPLDLESVTTPGVSPSDEPDPFTEKGMAGPAGPAKPTDRIIESFKLHIATRERERIERRDEVARLLGVCEQLQAELDRIRPDHAALQQARRNAESVGSTATLAMTFGSIVAGAAGLFSDPGWKYGLLSAGGALTAVGACFSWQVNRRGWHSGG